MADDAIFIGWGPVIPGREQQALELFGETMSYYARLQQDGKIESFEACLLGPHGGDLDGFILLRGERSKLGEVRFSEEFERFTARATLALGGVGVVPAYTGESLGRLMGMFGELTSQLS